MGSWNHTCAVSNLHIGAGEEVVVFLLLKNHNTDDGSFCYGNALYDVMPLPFYGKYDDYGGVEDCHGFGLPILIEELRARLYKFGQGPNEVHDCEVTPEDFTVEKLFEADHANRLGIQDHWVWDNNEYQKGELEKIRQDGGLNSSQQFELDRLASKIKKQDTFRQITHVVVHGKIFKAITEKWYIEDYVGGGEGTAGYNNDYNHMYFKDLISFIPAYVADKRVAELERLQRIAEMDEDGIVLKSAGLIKLLAEGAGDHWNSPNLATRWMRHLTSSGSQTVWGFINVEEHVKEYVEAKDWDGLAKFTHEVLTASWINSFMSYTRKIWVKQTGQGSQNREPLGYKVLAEATLDILEDERREYEDYEDEDEDEVEPTPEPE